MSEQTYERVAIQVVSTDAAELEHLRAQLPEGQAAVSPVRSVPATSDLHLDPLLVGAALFSVTTVITQVGGALQIIDWTLSKIRARRSGIVIKVGDDRIEISDDADPVRTRRLLEAALQVTKR